MKTILTYESFSEDRIPGGLSNEKTLQDIQTNREIDMDHLMENPEYYDNLDEIESKSESLDTIISFSKFFEKKKSYSGSHGGLDKWFKEKWVDISKTNPDGSHPPCGRDDTSKGGYPKCRKVRVAAKMSKKQKRASVSRKRKVEREGKKGPRTPNYSK
jgi:hypothetical protein